MSDLCCLHVGPCDDIFLADWPDMVRDFALVTEENLGRGLQTRLGKDVKV